MEGEFGFVTLDRTHTLTSFEAYAKWAKALHFGVPYQKVGLRVVKYQKYYFSIQYLLALPP